MHAAPAYIEFDFFSAVPLDMDSKFLEQAASGEYGIRTKFVGRQEKSAWEYKAKKLMAFSNNLAFSGSS